MNASPLLLVMAGGTGGHIFPGLAVANNLRAKGWKIHWLGSANGMEQQIVEKEQIEITLLPVSGVRGKGWLKKLISPVVVLRSIWQATKCLKIIAPDVVLGMGGFASGPGGVAAKLLNKPLLIHEQNSIAGYTNKLLATIANQVLSAFPKAFGDQQKALVVGNPIRSELCELDPPSSRFENRDAALRVLVIGGSRGALVLNQTIPAAVARLGKAIELKLQCGAGNKQLVESLFEQNPTTQHNILEHRIEVVDFITDMATAFGWADIVICRAGALTVSELMAVGLGALFVPYPYAVDDHQTANAEFLSSKKAADIIPQDKFDAAQCALWLEAMNREKALEMASNAYDENSHLVAARIGKLCEKLKEDQLHE